MDDKYTRSLAETEALSRPAIEEEKALDGRDAEIAATLPLDGTDPMEGPLQLVDDADPGTEHYAVPMGWVFDEAERVKNQADNAKAKSGNAHSRAKSDIGDFAKWLHDNDN